MSEGRNDGALALSNQLVATLLGSLLSAVTVWDRVRAAPIVERDDTYELAVADDGELVLRITPPAEYDAAVRSDSGRHTDPEPADDGTSSWTEVSVSGEGISVSHYRSENGDRATLVDEWWRTHEEIETPQATDHSVRLGGDGGADLEGGSRETRTHDQERAREENNA